MKVTTGNNGGKFLFEVVYAEHQEGLHTKLFAKVPHVPQGKTKSDRLSSSVNKQPQEFYELNTHRLLEAVMPVRMAKFYFGDVSNVTSNFILITECIEYSRDKIDFSEPKGVRKGPLPPMMIEEPYDKCADWNLRTDPFDYYLALTKCGARMAGLYKAGKLGDVITLSQNFENWESRAKESWGMNKDRPTGLDPRVVNGRIDGAFDFMTGIGAFLYPEYVQTQAFQTKMRRTLLTMSAYSAELMYWRHTNQDYVALTHQNLNVDNAFFWRDDKGELELGVIDWGNMGSRSLGFKFWWWLYCADYGMLTENIDTFCNALVMTYEEFGGPTIDRDELKRMFIITGLEQLGMFVAAVPQIYAMCPKKEWNTIKSRYDPRIGDNIDGKSTIRLYLQVLETCMRMVEEWGADQVLNNWIVNFYHDDEGKRPKSKDTSGDIFEPDVGLGTREVLPPVPIGLLFPGQGSQYIKMLNDVKFFPGLRDMLEKAKPILGYDIMEICLEGPEDKLEETRYCQPALYIAGLAGLEKLESENFDAATRPQAVAGLSLGEYTALCVAGVFTFAQGLELVKLRGEAMQEAAAQGKKQCMLSVAGIEIEELQELCNQARAQEGEGAVCQISNFLFPAGASVGGTEKAIIALKKLAENAGALQAKILKTAGAFHTPLMGPAQEKLAKALDEALPYLRSPTTTVYMNVTGQPVKKGADPKDIVELLKRQITEPVLWEASIRGMISEGIAEFFECGPNKQLTAMMKRIDQKVWKVTKSITV